jgi:hypothetical protein
MSMRAISKQIEKAKKALAARAPVRSAWPDTEEWIAQLKESERAGYFRNEPDFPKALALYLDALGRARAAGQPVESDVPADQRPRYERFPDELAEYYWISEISWRVFRGIPPVTEAEFAELGAWFAANEERLEGLADSSSLLNVGRGRKTCCWYIRFALRQGPRAEGAGESAEDIRQLRARYGS